MTFWPFPLQGPGHTWESARQSSPLPAHKRPPGAKWPSDTPPNWGAGRPARRWNPPKLRQHSTANKVPGMPQTSLSQAALSWSGGGSGARAAPAKMGGVETKDHGTTSNTVSTRQQSREGGLSGRPRDPCNASPHSPLSRTTRRAKAGSGGTCSWGRGTAEARPSFEV